MSKPDPDKAFTGTIAQVYQQHLVPLIFEPYAGDLVSRLQARPLSRVLEVAAGTGVVTGFWRAGCRRACRSSRPL